MSPSPVSIKIESLGGLGDGIATHGGKPLFVSKSCAGDVLSVRLTQTIKEHARGEIIAIETAGADRVAPPCPYFSDCGGCALQQLSEPAYRTFKQRMAETALAQAGFPDTKIETMFLPAASRRRVEFKWDGASLAYYAARSHDLVPVESCLILEPTLQALMAPLKKLLPTLTNHRSIRTVSLTAADSGIDMILGIVGVPPQPDKLHALAEKLGVIRISLAPKDKPLQVALTLKPVTMQLADYPVRLPPDAFLQASTEGQKILTDAILAATDGAKHIVDLFCGIGTYSFPLSQRAKTHAVEDVTAMVNGMKKSIKDNDLTEHLSVEERDLFRMPLTAKELHRFDAVVINPPRIGAKKQCEELGKSAIKRVVMVSCNPATFARDAKTLKSAGFHLESALAVDQFVYSPHLEIVAVFQR